MNCLLMTEQRTVVPSQFFYTVSLQFLAIAVVGGLGSLSGAVAAGVLFAGLNELFFRVSALGGWLDVVSALLLAGVLLLYPVGLAGLLDKLSSWFAVIGEYIDRGLAPVADKVRELREKLRREAKEPAVTATGGTGSRNYTVIVR